MIQAFHRTMAQGAVLLVTVGCWFEPRALAQDGVASRIGIDEAIDVSGGIAESAAGDLTGDLRVDIVVRIGSHLYLVLAPATFDLCTPLDEFAAQGTTSVAVQPRNETKPDRVVATGAAGLTRWEFDGTTFQPTVLDRDAAWVDATNLIVEDVNGDGLPDAMALASDGGAVAIALGLESGDFGSVVARSFEGAYTVYDIETVRWIEGAERQIACMTGLDVVFLDHGGQTVAEPIPLLGTGGRMRGIEEGGTTEALVLLEPSGPTTQLLSVKRPVEVQEPGFTVNWLDFGPLGSGDVDGDGDDDLLGVPRFPTDPVSLLFLNTTGDDPRPPGTPTYSLTPGTFVAVTFAALGTQITSQNAHPVFEDLDLDGDLDVFLGVQGAPDCWLQRNSLESESAYRPVWDPLRTYVMKRPRKAWSFRRSSTCLRFRPR